MLLKTENVVVTMPALLVLPIPTKISVIILIYI